MSTTRLLCRLASLLLALMLTPIVAPTVAPAQDEVWIDIAGALWRDGSGRAHVASGYSGGQPTAQAATASALQQCQSVGGRGCQNVGPTRGCGYVTVGTGGRSVYIAIKGSPEEAVAAIRAAGATSWQPPIGGCGQ